MPTYEYVCTKCGEGLEAVQKFSDPPLAKCPRCKGKLRKVFSPVGVVFKGSGFYKTDSRSASKSSSSPTKEPASASSTSDSSTGSSGSDSTGGESASKSSGSDSPGSGSGSSSSTSESSSSSSKKKDGGSKVA